MSYRPLFIKKQRLREAVAAASQVANPEPEPTPSPESPAAEKKPSNKKSK